MMQDDNIEKYLEGLKYVANDSYFRSLAETIPHFLIVIDPETYRIQYLNRLDQGFTLESVIGREAFEFVWPEHVDLYRQKFNEAKSTRTTQVFESVGQSAHGKAWYRTYISILPGPNNSIASLMLLAENITNSKLKEIEVFEKGEKLKAIINNTNDIICSIDLNYNLTEFNSVFVQLVNRGYKTNPEIGMSIFSFVEPSSHPHLKNIYKRIESGESHYEVQSFNTSIGLVYNETNYHPILDANKKVIGISVFSKDITSRVKQETEIKRALKEKEVLLAEIHHRIKNNLAMVSSMLQLQEMNINNSEAREALSYSRKRIKSTALIHELLYKNESFQDISLMDYIKELFKHVSVNDNIHLELKGTDVKMDIVRAMPLGLMLNEIMMNSFKHSFKNADEGKTTIQTKVSNQFLDLEYCDCKGEFPNHIDFKNSNTTGLTLIHTFAEQLNGSIELVSFAPPKYIISIPLNG
ncbi:MAG TPA: histidine kinase dimerization/phosphoacceptor domain -containing protein [Bacteroidia bacterium]|nr:PAS domain S-box protein [Bacteroidia bacterium]HRD38207.1 histidine kinase dimerization/phosphoacceptor domain -containing protein [Bacteroidia bacterium]